MCVPPPSVHLEPLAEAPTASVCIAAYQAEGTILAAVLSALTQTWPPLEVVVVDDGSSDGTAQVLADVDDPRLRVLHQANAGEAAAKNAAVQAARGDLVVVLDADDAWYPERLAALMALARARPDLDVLTTDADLTVDGLIVRQVYGPSWPFEVHDQRGALLVRNTIFSGAAVRRSTWLGVGGMEDGLSPTADWDLWQRLVLAGSSFGLVDVPLARYTVGTQNMSSDRLAMNRARARQLRRVLTAPGLSSLERSAVRAALREQERAAATGALKRALAQRAPVRRLALVTALGRSGADARGRLLALAVAAAPGLAASRLAAVDDGTVQVVAGVRVPRR